MVRRRGSLRARSRAAVRGAGPGGRGARRGRPGRAAARRGPPRQRCRGVVRESPWQLGRAVPPTVRAAAGRLARGAPRDRQAVPVHGGPGLSGGSLARLAARVAATGRPARSCHLSRAGAGAGAARLAGAPPLGRCGQGARRDRPWPMRVSRPARGMLRGGRSRECESHNHRRDRPGLPARHPHQGAARPREPRARRHGRLRQDRHAHRRGAARDPHRAVRSAVGGPDPRGSWPRPSGRSAIPSRGPWPASPPSAASRSRRQ